MPLLDKITKATQDMVRGAKDFTDTARQNSMISDEQKKIDGLYAQIGKIVYETQRSDPNSQIGQLCLSAK